MLSRYLEAAGWKTLIPKKLMISGATVIITSRQRELCRRVTILVNSELEQVELLMETEQLIGRLGHWTKYEITVG